VVTYLCNQYAIFMNVVTIEEVYKEIGKRIIEARKSKSMSQEQLAISSGIDRTHMGFIEQGRRKPTLSTLFKISNSLNVSLEQIFKGF